jgi:hypothetical protein
MKTPLAIALFLNCFIGSLSADDFDNWFFDFFSKPVISSGKFETPDGRHVETCTGVQTGEVSNDGKGFIQNAKLEYKNQGTKVEVNLRWKRMDDDSFEGIYTDSNGNTVKYSLILKAGKSFRIVSTATNGMKMVSDGKLDGNEVMRTLDKMTEPDGSLIVSITNEMKQKSKDEPGGAEKPSTGVNSTSEDSGKSQLESKNRPQ